MLTDYCIQYREAGSNLPFTEVYVGSNTTVFHLTGLKPLYSYEVRVAANTSAGRGPFSSVVTSCRSPQHMFNCLTNNLFPLLFPSSLLHVPFPSLLHFPLTFHLPYPFIHHFPFCYIPLLLPPPLPSLLPFHPPSLLSFPTHTPL